MTILFRIVLLFLLSIVIFPAAAQDDLTQNIDLPEGYTISVPEDWELEADDDSDGIYLNNADFTVYILTPPQVAEIVTIGKSPDVVDLMVDINVALFDWQPDADNIDSVEVAGFPASRVYYDLEGDEFEGVSYVIEMGKGEYAFIDGVASIGKIDELEDILIPMLRTFQVANAPVSVGSGEPCFVSTDVRDTARLRVGPGENRSSVAFLPVGDDFEVQGQFTDDDGNIWYQLDKAAAAPQSAASEIWVAQADVSETGDCASVVDASAPPVVPITNNPPANTSSGSNTGSTDSGGVAPAGGLWIVNLNSEADASCEGTGNFHVPTTEVFSPVSFPVAIAVSGSTMFFDGSPFSRTSGSTYFGSIQISNGNAQLTLTVVNANLITGQMVANAVFNGRACSTTIGLTATR